MISYSIKKLTESDIFNYLSDMDRHLIPSLSSRVDIRSYSQKLKNHSLHFCAFDYHSLIGFAACYFNDPKGESGFISSFSVVQPYRGKGIATNLLNMIKYHANAESFKKIDLKVYLLNKDTILFYEKAGFIKEVEGDDERFITMTYFLR